MTTLPAALTHANGSKSQRRGWAGPTSVLLKAVAAPAMAQGVVPKLGNICPLGDVDTLNGKCATLGLTNYIVMSTHGKACLSGWMNVGGRSCRCQ